MFVAGVLGASIASLPVARADKVDDFKDASTKEGCEAIPYSDTLSNCRSSMKDVSHWCGGYKGPVKCDVGPTGDLITQIDKEQKYIVDAKDQRRELEDKRARAVDARKKADLRAQIEQLDKDVDASTKRIEEAKKALAKQKDTLEGIMYTISKCTEARNAVLKEVVTAREKVAGESDPALKEFADKLRGKYEGFTKIHETQIKELTKSSEVCKKGVPR